MFWTNQKILSYNKTFNFVIGQRTGGKTYDSKCLAIRTFLKNKKETVWIRREKTEISKKFRDKFFSDVLHLYPKIEFEMKTNELGATAFINGEPAIHFVALSVYYKHKSIPFQNVKWIVFDEFIVNTRAGARYLKGEAFSFMEIYHSIARPYSTEKDGKEILVDPKTRVLFLGNSISIVNPYFAYFNLKVDKSREFNVFNNQVVQIWDGSEHRKFMESTSLGQSMVGTPYLEYAQENHFFLDNDLFIEQKTPKSKYVVGFLISSQRLGVWIDYQQGVLFVNRQVDPTNLLVSVEIDDHQPNLLMIQHFKRLFYYRQIKTAFENGLIRYSDHNTMNLFYELMGFL